MNILLLEDKEKDDIDVQIQYPLYTNTVQKLEEHIRAFQKTIRCFDGQQEKWIPSHEIYYLESVDKRTYLYCRDTVYPCESRLYQLIGELAPLGFIQVSKSCILNLNMLESLRPLLNSRLEATLSNGEKINVNRKYVSHIKQKLLHP